MENIINKNDFIEIEFTGTSNGEIFDTTNPVEAKKIGLNANVKPMVVSAGNSMLLQGLDEEVVGKEVGKEYSIHLTPDKAFGKRNPSLIRTMPEKIFKAQKITPYPGLPVQFDNTIAKVISVSGGRITVDFNNPLAGKEVDYKFTIKRKISDTKEKVSSLQDYFFRMQFEFEVNEATKKVIFKKQDIKPFLEMFKEKFKEMTGYEFEVEEVKKEDKNNEKKTEKETKSVKKEEESEAK